MNVGRNYNGPKVLKLSQEGFRMTGTVIAKFDKFKLNHYTKKLPCFAAMQSLVNMRLLRDQRRTSHEGDEDRVHLCLRNR